VPITVWTPTINQLGAVVTALATWQQEGVPVQLHPGDLGWQWRFGAEALASLLRVWSRDGEIVAIGFGDGDVPADELTVVRMAVAPSVDQDAEVARVVVGDLEDASSGALRAGVAAVEARSGRALRSQLRAHGWLPDEAWTPLRRELADPVEECLLRVETARPSLVQERVAVQVAAFPRSTFTTERWHAMAAGGPYRQARCLVGFAQDVPVAAVTVWSAGPGRPGLLEPLGVHRHHRGQGHGRAITLAAAAALREMGASSATVATPSSNTAAVATYVSAGFEAAPDVTDFRRP
jgi:ribosomal protein S18 acetylase RimI-like enzyme